MARFILDVANLLPHQIKEVQDAVLNADIVHKSAATIHCIDETNENQFYSIFTKKDAEATGEVMGTNELSKEQINYFKTICN
jgi:hypothetical protein